MAQLSPNGFAGRGLPLPAGALGQRPSERRGRSDRRYVLVATAVALVCCGPAAAVDRGSRVEDLLAAAREKAAAGATAEALTDLRAANALVKQAQGSEAPELLPILDMAADLLIADGQLEAAESPVKRALALRETLAARGAAMPDAELAGSLAALGTLRAARGGFVDAEPLLGQAVARFTKALGPTHASTTATLLRLAEVQLGLGKPTDAEASCRAALERALERDGPGDPEVPAAAGRLARTLAFVGRPAAGIDAFATAIADLRRAVGDSADIPPLLRDLADLQLAAGDTAAAAATADDALDIDRGQRGDEHPAAAIDRLLRIRADVAAGASGDLAAADAIAKRLAADAAGDEPLAAAALRCAALLAADVQDAPRAAECWRLALDADRRILGEDHADAATDRVGLARGLLAAGDAAEAGALADRAADALTLARGPAHPETLEAAALAGGAAAARGDLASAARQLDRILAAQAPRSGPYADRDLARLAEGVALLREKAGDTTAAAATRDAPLAMRQRQFGESGPEAMAMLVQLAEARHDAGAPAAAVPLYEKALALVEKAHGPDHPEVAAILAPLGSSLRAADEHAAAAAAFSRALAIWEATVGPDHPATLATVKALALAWLAAGIEDDALPLMKRLLAGYDADPSTPPLDVARLVRKLGKIHRARGEDDIARAYLDRADAIEKELSGGAAAAPPARGG